MEKSNIVRNAYTYHLNPSSAETNSAELLTVPDLTYTPQQLLQRYKNGQSFPKLSTISYHQDIKVPDPRTLDLVEMHELIDAARENSKQVKASYEEVQKLRKKQQEDANNAKLAAIVKSHVTTQANS